MKTNKTLYRYLILLGFIFLLQNNLVKAQDDEEITWRERLYAGGGFVLMVGTITDIEIEPLLGYRITPRWSAGILTKYGFYKSSDQYLGNYSTSLYGAGAFTEFTFFKNFPSEGLSINAHTEIQSLSLENKYFGTNLNTYGRFIQTTFFVGTGLRQKTGKRSSANLYILWPVGGSGSSPYSSATLKFTYVFGLF